MQEKIDTEEQARMMQLVEKAEENEERRGIFYGSSQKTSGNRKRPKVYLFELNDLDNDEIISMVEITPTYKRTKELLNDIKAKAQQEVAIEPEIITTSNITF